MGQVVLQSHSIRQGAGKLLKLVPLHSRVHGLGSQIERFNASIGFQKSSYRIVTGARKGLSELLSMKSSKKYVNLLLKQGCCGIIWSSCCSMLNIG